MKKQRPNQDYQNYSFNHERISDKDLIASRRQEMEEFILPNHQTTLQLQNGQTVIIKSKEVKLWAE